MMMRIAPASFESNRRTGFVNPLGPHQVAINLLSVHILKTRFRGASNTRVITRSWTSTFARLSFFVALFFIFRFHFLQSHVHGIEFTDPEIPVLNDPLRYFIQFLKFRLANSFSPVLFNNNQAAFR